MGSSIFHYLPIFGLVTALSVNFVPRALYAGAALDIESTSGCVKPNAVRARLKPVLEPYADARGGTIAVVSHKAGKVTSVTLRVVALNGDVVFYRRLKLQPEDCPSAPALIATIIDRFLHNFPRARWTDLPAHESSVVVIGHQMPWIVAMMRTTIMGRYPQPGADLDLGLSLETGTARHRLYIAANARSGTPIALGIGKVFDSTATGSIGWREISDNCTAEFEIRVGGRLTSGIEYSVNRNVWLPWIEFETAVSWPWGPWLFGPMIAVSPLQQRAKTAAGARVKLPWIHLGLGAWIPLTVDLL
ncbi:MAG: hypothetical protein JW841_14160 [Deltaproteobacteria bacterium]|nr:hypothetical protein [Deltaproteobacteria bacterium]